MFADFKILGSSSHGNCALLRTAHTKVLVDAGFSGRRIGQLLAEMGESIDAIDAVFLTHEHGDHAQGLRGLSKRADLPVFANRDTAEAVQAKLTRRMNWQVFQTGTSFRFRDLEVRSFQLPHDAYDPVGFKFAWGEEGDLFAQPGSLAWVVDLGYVPEHVREQLRSVDTLVIEANYDEKLLDKDEKKTVVDETAYSRAPRAPLEPGNPRLHRGTLPRQPTEKNRPRPPQPGLQFRLAGRRSLRRARGRFTN